MRNIMMNAVAMLALIGGVAHAASTNDETFANSALRELHTLAAASAQFERTSKDSDRLGCREAHDSLQQAAHEALANMHEMSFAPIDALERVSTVLRASNRSPDECLDEAVVAMDVLPMVAGQAIMGLRTDYAVGDADWYMVNASGAVEARNPLRYAQSLSNDAYSWVDLRSKGVDFLGVSDWKAEMASVDVNDSSIKNLGNKLKVVEVDYRKNSGDDNTYVYFYRTREDANAATQAAKQQAEDDAKAAEDAKASNAMWGQKLMALPYMIANRDVGFKLIYAVCKPTGENAKGQNTCSDDGSYDWSDNRAVPYRWFGDTKACDDAASNLEKQHPTDVDPNGNFATYCVPAPKANGHAVKGYKAIIALTAPGAEGNDNIYADLRERGSQSATVFKTFNACQDAADAAYSKAMKDLGADEGGTLLSDKMKVIGLTVNCLRIY